MTDENSPFNECAHAYLAGARALLMHLREMPGDRRAVDALVAKIETGMLANNAALGPSAATATRRSTRARSSPFRFTRRAP